MLTMKIVSAIFASTFFVSVLGARASLHDGVYSVKARDKPIYEDCSKLIYKIDARLNSSHNVHVGLFHSKARRNFLLFGCLHNARSSTNWQGCDGLFELQH